MQKLLKKIISTILTVVLIGTNIAPTMVYATSIADQNAKTKEENVEFNASINNEYNTSLDVNSDANLILNVKVSETGYLKESTVTIENNNYEIIDTDNVNVKSINGNVITLDEVNAGEVLNVSLPIRIKKEDRVLADILGKDSTVTLNAIYVNQAGKERKIEKTLTEHLEWTADVSEEVSQTLVRYLKSEDNKTIVSFKLKDGLKDNIIPINSKEIVINVPNLGESKPSEVIVTGKNISYNYENDLLTINKENKADSEGKISWNSQDEYMVTYIYDAQVEEAVLNSNVLAKINVKGNTVEGKLENSSYEVKEQLGTYIEGEILATGEINKGYMYTNNSSDASNLETPFETTYNANISYKNLTDNVKIVENDTYFDSLNASNSVIDKKVKIERDNLVEILGEEGSIKVLSENNEELGILSKDKLELDINTAKIVLETSKVMKEGDLQVVVSKAIVANKSLNKKQIENLTELKTNIKVEGYKDEKLNSSKEISAVSKFTEPTSNADIDLNVQNLSTVVTNEDVQITATLKTNDISDALYSNAKVDIVFPEEVKSINLKEAGLIYEDELKLNNLTTNGNKISLNLDGTQTKYSSQATAEGTVLRLIADLTLDNLAPTAEKEVVLNYTNSATGEANSVQDLVEIVAPTGFVTTNSIEVDGNKVTSQESKEQIAKIVANSTEKVATLSSTVVNNLGEEASGVNILGVIPTSNNKDANESDLGSNFDTTIIEGLNASGANAQVFYSENVNEKIDGSSWTNNFSENAKLYKIAIDETVPNGTAINFNYKVKVPSNLDYGKIAKSTYAVYYNNNAEMGNNKNIVLAKATGMTTGNIPVITVEDSLINLNTDEKIEKNNKNQFDVKEGTIFVYRLTIRNTGKETANNVKVKLNLPDGLSFANTITDMSDLPIYQYDYTTKTAEKNIETLEEGKEYNLEYILAVTGLYINLEEENNDSDEGNTNNINETAEDNENKENELTKHKITAEISADKIQEKINKETVVNIVKGDIEATVTSDKTNSTLNSGDSIEYCLFVRNANFDDKKNIQATITLPKEFEVENILNESETKYEHDKNKNIITYTIPTLEGGTFSSLYLELKVGDIKENKKLDISAKIKCDDMEQERKLQTLSYNVINNPITVSMTSNIDQNSLSDTDDLEYYINITNNNSQTTTVSVNDKIPGSLRVIGYNIQDENGNKTIEASPRNIMTSLQIGPSQTARLTISTEPYKIRSGNVSKIENKATITTSNISLETNTLTHTIVGTSQTSAGTSTEEDNNNQGGNGNEDDNFDDEPTEAGTYKINGTVWIDANADGRKDENEERIPNLTVRLYDKSTGKIAVDVNGKEQVKTTNEQGRYTFVNVTNGNYIVVIEYDNINYGLAKYRVEGLSEAENSDFVSGKIDEKEIAATDEIIVTDSNTYNIDLGLVKGKVFDLDINKAVRRITVTNTKAETRVYDYEDLAVAKVELATANIDFATVLVEYTIKITNEGNVAGYAKSIADYIPEGMTFNSELNNSWYLGKDGVAYNTSLANTIINPGETKEINIVLSRKMSGENIGTVRNRAEILSSYNEYGLEDRDIKDGVSQDKTEDKSSADIVIAMATGREIASFTGITLGILALIALAVYEIKKHIINKMYNII